MKHCVIHVITLGWALTSLAVAANSRFSDDVSLVSGKTHHVILKSSDNHRQLLIAPEWQGRVLTSTAHGLNGLSNGWVNRKAIEKNMPGQGGEERLWIAPIGSQYSLFYPAGNDFSEHLWRVPPALTKTPFQIISKTRDSVSMQAELSFENMKGTRFDVEITRIITLHDPLEIKRSLGVSVPETIKTIGYSSANTLRNTGEAWQPETGRISPWVLNMFQGEKSAFTMIPLQKTATTDNVHVYLSEADSERMQLVKDTLLYRTDGDYRNKIGIPASISGNYMLAYFPSINRLTVTTFDVFSDEDYPIGFESHVSDDVQGDVTNIYNHISENNVAGFFEMESAAPLISLKTNGAVTHKQVTVHLFGKKKTLLDIAERLTGTPVDSLNTLNDATEMKKASHSY